MKKLEEIIDLHQCPLTDVDFIDKCRNNLDKNGVLVLPTFLNHKAIEALVIDAEENQHKAFYSNSTHNVYLTKSDPQLDKNHIFNRQIISSKGCITTDQISKSSLLKTIYNSEDFKFFISNVIKEERLYEYVDSVSSINVHFANSGQELGWHFDNSSFAITLLLQAPLGGGVFEYVKDVRNSEIDDMAFDKVSNIVDNVTKPLELKIEPGTLVLFRGRNSMHRVTPTEGKRTRILAVFAYNSKPGIALCAEAQKTFFGREV